MITASESLEKITDMAPFSSWPGGSAPDDYFRESIGRLGADFYKEKGFLVLDRVLSEAEVDAINEEAVRLCRNEDGLIHGIPPAPSELSDSEVLQEILCIHFPHKMSEIMRKTLVQPAIVQALTQMVGPNVKCMQSMLFLKGAGKPGQAWHQDEDYIPTRDRSLIGAWIALDDATVENGCLWIIPGSHQPGILWEQIWHEDRGFDCSLESQDFPYTAKDEIPVEVKKGSVVFFNGYTLHRSLPNRAKSGFRRALVNHYMSAESLLPWRYEQGTSMALQDYRDIVLVAGVDPYSSKGITDIAKPMVRPTGDGGCIGWSTKEALSYKN